MKRALVLLGLVALAAAGVSTMERLSLERQYRQLLVDGERALGEGQTYAAIEAFSGALALRPHSMVAFYRRGEAYGRQEQVSNAVRDLRAAHALAPDAPQPLEALGRLFDRRGEPAEAARWYAQAALLLKDADPALLYSLAVAQYRAGRSAAARESLQRAIAKDDAMTRAHYLLGVVYRDMQQPDEAMASLQQALKLTPTFVAARDELADLLRAIGRTADAETHLATLAIDDAQPRRLVALAAAQFDEGETDYALATLTRARIAAPGDSSVALALGRVLLARAEQTGDVAATTQAVDILESALAGTARRSEGLALYARALHLSGDAATAERLLEEAVATRPVAADAYRYLADAADTLRHPSIAMGALRRLEALEGDMASPPVRAARARRLGRLALDIGDASAATTYLRTAIQGGQTDPTTWRWLAEARRTAGDVEGARAALANGLAHAPDDPELVRLLRALE